ncbi:MULTISPECIES: type III secretion system gatekeeper subunit SctW [unclassified Brenneria]|uniref:type III secretion system gatekeeper subunit SctW n=1 Tax=unclassified Brenneria TaxID=2634434 RepID=UPI0029C3CA8B|nr:MULTISPECIES: type III secretion system gatekeeper subunit SctW [unclassified Brenneria]MDX5626663.1 type III secretion system gatekeeper subunit SctW [Brenneria sp. L3-3Z]MDX5693987.1 type III secretion system gatekeeper subunit SctW [Brenneria sp. L4-2C]
MIKIQSVTPAPTPITRPIETDNDPAAQTAAIKAPAHHEALRPPLATSMEEVAMAFGEQAERRSKSLNRRHIAQTGVRTLANVERIEKLTELFKLLENPAEGTYAQQMDRLCDLLGREKAPTVAAILQAVGNDAARGDVLLRQVRAKHPALTAAAQQALQRLHQEKEPEIRAGLNTASAISLFSTLPEHRQTMRDLYYQKVVHQQSVGALLDALLERVDPQHFQDGLRTMQRALAADIVSQCSSIPKTALRKMLGSLNDSLHLSHTLATSREMLDRLSAKLPAFTLGAVELTRRLIGLSANGAYARDLHNLGREVAGTEPPHQALFFSALLPLVSGLPQPLWRDLKNRQTALHLIRGLIGDATRHENNKVTLSPKPDGLA